MLFYSSLAACFCPARLVYWCKASAYCDDLPQHYTRYSVACYKEAPRVNYATIKYCDIANGTGVRTSLFVSGCRRLGFWLWPAL